MDLRNPRQVLGWFWTGEAADSCDFFQKMPKLKRKKKNGSMLKSGLKEGERKNPGIKNPLVQLWDTAGWEQLPGHAPCTGNAQ